MSKYIDTEKLIAEINRRLDELNPKTGMFGDRPLRAVNPKTFPRESELEKVLCLIDSLQQEQPKFKVGDTIHKIGENTIFPMAIKRIHDGDYVCVTEHQQSFINIKFQDDYELVEQEQPEQL